ncbi:MAG: Ig-like domain-containing protein, partial [Myxococcota bacterium]
DQQTPSLATIVQERVNAIDWQPGDALSFLVSGPGGGGRSAAAFDGSPTGAPLLHVEFDPPANHHPEIAITSPLQGTTVFAGSSVSFAGTASDFESSDVTASLMWTSSLDGILGTGGSFSRSDLTVGAHTITVTATDGAGGFSSRTLRLTVFAAEDTLVAAGDIGTCTETGDEGTGALVETLAGTILGLGDYADPAGATADFDTCFDSAWGRHRARMQPVPGDVEYQQAGATPYFTYFGSAAGDPTKGYYSFDVGDWHIVALNSRCDEIGGCQDTSPMGLWLDADLLANEKACMLAYLHDPRFSSGEAGVDDTVFGLWQMLYDYGVDVILQGDDQAYERFARMGPTGVAEPLRGIRSFVVGTGGQGFQAAAESEPNSEVRDETTFGVLQLTLAPTSYSWEFLGAGPGSFTDSGSEDCVPGVPIVNITSPATGANFNFGANVTLSATATDLEEGDLSASTVWSSSKDGPLGTGATIEVNSLSTGSHKLFARVTDATGLLGDHQVSVNINAPSGGGGGCGIGPELAPGLGLLALLRARRRSAGRRRSP